jgi:hypothetical protein
MNLCVKTNFNVHRHNAGIKYDGYEKIMHYRNHGMYVICD